MNLKVSVYDVKNGIRDYELNNFHKDVIGFGRQSDCDIVMNSSFVSRLHGCIYNENGSWFIKDLDSSYGLLYNKKRIAQMRLNGGEHIIIMSPSGEYVELIFDAYNDKSAISANQSMYNVSYQVQNKKSVNRVAFIITSIMLWLLLIGTYFLPWSTIDSGIDLIFLDDIVKKHIVPVDIAFGPSNYNSLFWLFLFVLPFIALHVACFKEYEYIVLGIIVAIINLVLTIICIVILCTPLLYLVDNGNYENDYEIEIKKRLLASVLSPNIGCFLAIIISFAILIITIIFFVLMLKENNKEVKSGTLRALKIIGICILAIIVINIVISFVRRIIFIIKFK